MTQPSVPDPVDTDALPDTSPAAMAARFGDRTRQLLRDGRDVRGAARLAASYAFRVDPSLRGEPTRLLDVPDYLWRRGSARTARRA